MGAIISQSQISSFDPQFWTRHLSLRDQTRVFIRPLARGDEGLFREFLDHITPEDLRKRFFGPVKDFSPVFVSALVDIDYSTAFAALALDESNGLMLGGVRLMLSEDQQTGEYAIMLRSDFKGRGLGWQLMRLIIDYAKDKGLKRIEGRVLAQNYPMLDICAELGFGIKLDPQDPGIRLVCLDLEQLPALQQVHAGRGPL
ncbi:MAG: N-acetyltransferase [Alphaproteobacteria bacterium]|nr:N-acetyltransferase [Alphaproteobacteria bacterium]